FSITTTEGIAIDNDGLRRDGRPALIVFGSVTCPVTERAGDGLRELATRYGDRAHFIMVNVREAHPRRGDSPLAMASS
ncbi:MAG: deiodinase-like protein, partial [Mycobacterium sp.]